MLDSVFVQYSQDMSMADLSGGAGKTQKKFSTCRICRGTLHCLNITYALAKWNSASKWISALPSGKLPLPLGYTGDGMASKCVSIFTSPIKCTFGLLFIWWTLANNTVQRASNNFLILLARKSLNHQTTKCMSILLRPSSLLPTCSNPWAPGF